MPTPTPRTFAQTLESLRFGTLGDELTDALRDLTNTCAITGNLTLPEQTPYLPITPEEIANSALGAAEMGAAIVHLLIGLALAACGAEVKADTAATVVVGTVGLAADAVIGTARMVLPGDDKKDKK